MGFGILKNFICPNFTTVLCSKNGQHYKWLKTGFVVKRAIFFVFCSRIGQKRPKFNVRTPIFTIRLQ